MMIRQKIVRFPHRSSITAKYKNYFSSSFDIGTAGANSNIIRQNYHQHDSKVGNAILHYSTSSILDDLVDSKKLLKFNTLHELQENATRVFHDNPLFGTYHENLNNNNKGDDKFKWMSYGEFANKVSKCRNVLKHIGIQEYSKIGIIANNRWEWTTIAMAGYSLNATLVPMYEAQLSKDWLYILNDSQCDAVFCASKEIFDKVQKDVLPNAPSVKASLCLDDSAVLGESYAFSTAMKQAEEDDYQSSTSASMIVPPSPDDLANLIYTSGTTGRPKGVELTHDNFVSNIKGPNLMVNDPHSFVNSSDRSLSFLPWAHSYGQTCELWMLISHGASLGLCRGFTSILEDLQVVKPTMLFSVPTLYKRVYAGVHTMMESEASPIKRKLMDRSLELGRAKSVGSDLSLFQKLQYKILDDIVLKKIRDRFGGNLRHAFCAGAACPPDVLQFMNDIGVVVYEGYGLSETSPIITLNVLDSRKIGSVGKPLPDVNVVICDEEGNELDIGMEGEICCYGPNVMKGYFNKPQETDEVMSLSPDGKHRLFHTGDLGKMDNDGFLYITGRLKELYKLENGKYVCPTPIEEAISMSRFISQVVLCGANREHNVALIVPDWDAIQVHWSTNITTLTSKYEDIINDTNFQRLIDEQIESSCMKASLKTYEIPQKWSIVSPFTVANNMLTPKLSIRRHKVIQFYEDVIERMYDVGCNEDCETIHRDVV